MYLDAFHVSDGDRIRISAAQGSRFAKEVAGDFNPIHNPDAKRFVVPGDLLFSLVLDRYGLSRRMHFAFTDMVGADVDLLLPDTRAASFEITDTSGRACLRVTREGPVIEDPRVLEKFARAYVAFSGQTFPHVLVPLMRRHGVMINPQRPLVIYEGMSLDLHRQDFAAPALTLEGSSLDVIGKRGDVRLKFVIHAEGEAVGTGEKKLVLSGLREYDEAQVTALVDLYADWKRAYRSGDPRGKADVESGGG
ncbi:hypothetical protein B1C78_12250 [Thioalkalivibrio denitrificans]|uniref:DUF3581 domain-containing protein n=1 Tax=Thioalkalivibrio denitrificans TaxID=108003 RepID=A0A1V3NDJ6_9GAMM|nr:DUF3581 family protein [Thioalkalivibrio denitrificans]OOG23169.1 hypothetical protein B1C78_12250 [Thioalkalivibrio denitrificans]